MYNYVAVSCNCMGLIRVLKFEISIATIQTALLNADHNGTKSMCVRAAHCQGVMV